MSLKIPAINQFIDAIAYFSFCFGYLYKQIFEYRLLRFFLVDIEYSEKYFFIESFWDNTGSITIFVTFCFLDFNLPPSVGNRIDELAAALAESDFQVHQAAYLLFPFLHQKILVFVNNHQNFIAALQLMY